MADTYTTNLGMTKPEVGASTDTWGQKLNVNMDALDAVFANDGTGTSVGLQVGAGKTLRVSGTLDLTGGTLTGLTKAQVDNAQGGAAVLLAGDQNVFGVKLFKDGLALDLEAGFDVSGGLIQDTTSTAHQINISGNAGSVTNGVYWSNVSHIGGPNLIPRYNVDGNLGLGRAPLGAWDGATNQYPTFGVEFGGSASLFAESIDNTSEFWGTVSRGAGIASNLYYSNGWRYALKAPGTNANAGSAMRLRPLQIDFLFANGGANAAGSEAALNISATIGASGAYSQSSDERLKSDLIPIDGAVDKVSVLTGYTYDRKGSEQREMGLLAQDVRRVAPEVVSVMEDGYLSVAYGNLVALLVEAVKELNDRITVLEAM